VPVVVLSASGMERDVAESYGMHANAYVVKPVDLDRFVQVARAIKDFWFSAARLAGPG